MVLREVLYLAEKAPLQRRSSVLRTDEVQGVRLFLALLFVSTAFADDHTLTWARPLIKSDGTAIASTKALTYTVLHATSDNCMDLPDSSVFKSLVTGLTVLTWVNAGAAPGFHWYQIQALSGTTVFAYTNPVCMAVMGFTPALQAGPAYSPVKTTDALVLLAVGTITAGTSCDLTQSIVQGGATYYVVPVAAVTLSNPASEPTALVAKCF